MRTQRVKNHKKTVSSMLAVVLLTVLSTLVETRTNTDVLDKACKITDPSACSGPQITCQHKEVLDKVTNKYVWKDVCAHKPLFPMNAEDIWALIIMTVALSISSTVAISGGVVSVPFSILLLGMTTKQSVAMANAITVLKSSVKYFISVRTTSPKAEWKTAIDYNAALVTLPMITLFSVIGGIASSVIPDAIVTILMAVCLIQALYIGVKNWFRIRKQEKDEKEQANKEGASPAPDNKTSAQPAGNQVVIELPKVPVEGEPTDAPEKEALKQKKSEPTENQVVAVISPSASPEETIVTPDNEKKIQEQLKIEGMNFYNPKFLPIVLMIVLSILVSVLRPGKNPDSLVGIHKCSAGDFLILAGYALMMLVIPVYAYKVIMKEQAHKETIGWKKHHDEVYLNGKQMMYMNVWCGVSGLIATILGIGGGILLNPLMALMMYMPSTSSWTINLNALVGKIAATLVHIFFHELLYDYVLFYGFIIAFFVFWFETLVKHLMKKYGSQIIYATIFVGVVLFSLGMNLGVGIDRIIYDSSKGKNIWFFKALC